MVNMINILLAKQEHDSIVTVSVYCLPVAQMHQWAKILALDIQQIQPDGTQCECSLKLVEADKLVCMW